MKRKRGVVMNRFASSSKVSGFSSTAKKAAELLLVVVAILAISVPVFSQGAVGTILGGVYDTSGGAIAGAQVTITDVARGTTHVLTTDSSGQYTVPQLLVGTYSVKAEAKGFQTVENTNVLLEVSQSARVDLKLPPGQQSQTVTVTEVAPAINTTDATLGGTVTNQAVASLPLISRNFLQLLQLRPGVVDIPGGNGNATTTNGRREGADVLLVEGVTQFDLATSNVLINGAQKGGAPSNLPLDSVQEFSTQQNAPAEYGWRDGSAVNVAVKSGTNNIHGSAYAFGRDAAVTDAKQFSAVPGPESVGNLTVEQPGFTLGGPAIKDKLFWFVSAEFLRSSSFSTTSVAVPYDLASASGTDVGNSMVDACKTLTNNGANPGAINPLSAQLSGISNWGQVGGTGTLCTPQPATSTFENLWPYNPTTSVNTFPNPVSNTPSNNGLAKVDYSPNLKHHFDAFVYIARQTSVTGSNYQPYWDTLGIGSTAEYAGAWTYTPNSRWVNDLRGGAAPNSGNQVAGDAGRLPSAAYPGGYSINTGVTTSGYGFPCITGISGIFNSSSTGLGNCGKNGIRGPQYQLDFTDKVSYLRGNHAFKWGYEQVFVHFDDGSTANQNGTITFPDLEHFLQGDPGTNNGSVIVGDNTDHYRERWYAAFFQDTWRVSRNVTLTPGIRWEYIGSPHSTVDHLGTFDPNQPGGAIQVGPDLAPNTTVTHPQKTNFNPRMGVAWDIFGNGRTVLRAGVGEFSSFPAILSVTGSSVPFGDTMCNTTPTIGNPCPTASIVVNRYGTAINAATPGNTLAVPFATIKANWTSTCTNQAVTSTCTSATPILASPNAPSATNGPTCSPGAQCSMFVSNPNLKNPRSIQWNLDIQRAITNQLTLDVAYVGVHGFNEIHSVDLNQPAVGTGWDNTSIYTAACLGTTVGTPVAPTQTSLSTCSPDKTAITNGRPFNAAFPYFGYILQTQSGFISNYDALQMTLDSRNYHGLSFLTAYTYSHALDDWTKSSQNTSAEANPANPQYQYGNSDMDVRHRLRFSPTYTIPGIKTPGQMLEGWKISAIWALQTGFAWAPNDQTKNDWGGTGENGNPIARPNGGVWQSWNYSGPVSAFSNNGDTPIPCYSAKALAGCTLWSKAGVATPGTAAIWATCSAAAQAPYSTTLQKDLALAALTSANGACYIQNGGVLTPPAYGTLGNAARGLFTGPTFQNVDLSLNKMWHYKERYSAELRIEVYNVFNHVSFAQFSDGSSDPSAGGGSVSSGSTFGFVTAGQQLSGVSSNRQFQFGLKLLF
jgi:hypothetical protein